MSAIWKKAYIDQSIPGNCYDTAKKIYDGKHIRFDWRSALECSANIKYSKPDGTRLVLVDDEPGASLHKHAYLAEFLTSNFMGGEGKLTNLT